MPVGSMVSVPRFTHACVGLALTYQLVVAFSAVCPRAREAGPIANTVRIAVDGLPLRA